MNDAITTIRNLRKSEDLDLKPSIYLKSSFVDDFGEERQVILRPYQKIGVANILKIPRFILADDTGLGKTIQVLTSIGYIWLKEPNFVPIVVTTKSAIFQWAKETEKFMQNMEPIVVHGTAFERNKKYKEFFGDYSPERKRLLFLTYDNIMYDMDESIIKNSDIKPSKEYKKRRAEIKLRLEEAKSSHEAAFSAIHDLVSHDFLLKSYSNDLESWIGDKSKPFPIPPSDWTAMMDRAVQRRFDAKVEENEAKKEYQQILNEISTYVPGLFHHISEFKKSHPDSKIILVMDEAHKLKNHKSKFHEKTERIAKVSDRTVAMTATPVKNRLMEFFSIFKIVVPGLFPKISHFQNDFCVTKMQKIKGGRQVPIVVGYKNLDIFNDKIELYYLTRKKHEVAKDLPELLSREIECELLDEQEELYDMAESGASVAIDNEDESSGAMLQALTLCQQATDSPKLIMNSEGLPFDGESSKVEALLDLIEDEASGQKLIVFSRFESMISEIGKKLEEKKIKYVRITGAETNKKREEAKNTFQDLNSGIDIVLLTTAGSESINLQSAEHFVFFDLPWSYGDYIQLIGRMIRIGSSRKTVVAHHFLAKRQSGEKTIDHHVLQALRSKKKLFDKVAGNNLVGGLSFADENIAKDVISMMRGKKAGDPGTLLAQVNEKLAKRKSKKLESAKKIEEKYGVSEDLIVDFGDL